MRVGRLNHINIRTRDVAATVAFFEDVLMMRGALRFDVSGKLHSGRVFDDGGHAFLHIGSADAAYPGEAAGHPPIAGSGMIDHIAFDCAGYHEMRDRLIARGLTVIENDIPAMCLRQLFVRDPNGLKIELNF